MSKKGLVRLLIILMLTTGVVPMVVETDICAEQWGEDDQEIWSPNDNSEEGDLGESDSSSKKSVETNKSSNGSNNTKSHGQSNTTSSQSSTTSSHSNTSSGQSSSTSSQSSSTSTNTTVSSSTGGSSSTSSTTKKKPKITKKPKVTKKPKATKKPKVTEKPDATEEVLETVEPTESETIIDFSNIPDKSVVSFGLLITAYNSTTEVDSMVLPDGTICDSSITEYPVSENGVYGVTVNLVDGTTYYDEVEITCIQESTSEEQVSKPKGFKLGYLVIGIPVLGVIVVLFRKLLAKKKDMEHERILRGRRRGSNRE